MTETATRGDLGLRVGDLAVNGRANLGIGLEGGVLGHKEERKKFIKPPYIPEYPFYPPTRTVGGYPAIGEPILIGYNQYSVDVPIPKGNNRGLVFDTIDGKREFRLSFFEIGHGLHATYSSIGEETVRTDLKAYRTYAIPDGMERLNVQQPKIYNAHGKRVL